MNHKFSYEVTKTLQEDSLRQYFFSVMLGPRAILLLLPPCAVAGLVFSHAPFWTIASLGAVTLLVYAMWSRAYFQVMAQGRAGLRIMEHPRVEVTFSDVGVEYVSSTGVRKHSWDKIEHLKETSGFVILMHGKLPLLSLPKASMTPDILSFIHAKVNSFRFEVRQ